MTHDDFSELDLRREGHLSHDGVGNIVGREVGHQLQDVCRVERALRVGLDGRENLRGHEPGADLPNTDLVVPQLLNLPPPTLHDAGQGQLGRVVEDDLLAGEGLVAAGAVDEDDLPVLDALLDHELDAELGAEGGGHHVDVQDLPPGVGGLGQQRFVVDDACKVFFNV